VTTCGWFTLKDEVDLQELAQLISMRKGKVKPAALSKAKGEALKALPEELAAEAPEEAAPPGIEGFPSVEEIQAELELLDYLLMKLGELKAKLREEEYMRLKSRYEQFIRSKKRKLMTMSKIIELERQRSEYERKLSEISDEVKRLRELLEREETIPP